LEIRFSNFSIFGFFEAALVNGFLGALFSKVRESKFFAIFIGGSPTF